MSTIKEMEAEFYKKDLDQDLSKPLEDILQQGVESVT